MNFQDFRNLQKAYKQVYSSQRLNEFGPGDAGGMIGVKRTFGGAPGTKQNTTVSGSASLGGSNVSGSLEQGKFSGQGDNTSQGVTNALKNLENPNSKSLDTSTSTRTTGIRGTLSANVSGKIGSGVTPQDAARKRAMLTPAPATSPAQKPATPPAPATKLVQKPAPTTPPLARNMEAILKKKELVGDPAPPLAQKPAPPLATQTRLRGFM